MAKRTLTAMNDTFPFNKVGDTLTGKLTAIRTVKVDNEDRDLFDIEDKDGKTWAVWGTTTLTAMLKQVTPGDMVEVVYKGEDTSKPVKKGRSPMRLWEVSILDGQDIPF